MGDFISKGHFYGAKMNLLMDYFVSLCMDELDFDFDVGDVGGFDLEDVNLSDFNLMDGYEEETRIIKPKLYALKRSQVMYDNAYRLAEDLPWEKCIRYDAVVSGNFIFGDFIEAFIKKNNAKVPRMTISTLSLSQDNVDSLVNLIVGGYVEELNLIVSAYFYSHERRSLIPYIYQELDRDNRFQLAVAGIHTKTCHFETAGGKKIVIHGSANLRSSGNIEQFTIEENGELYGFYDGIYNEIINRYATIRKPIRQKQLWDVIKK